jgi:hypothetical protein
MRRVAICAFVVACGGCAYEMYRERYSSPAAPGGEPIAPTRIQNMGGDYKAKASVGSPVATVISVGQDQLLVAACNVYTRRYSLPLIPPFLFWFTTAPSRPLVFVLRLDGHGDWRIDVRRIVLERADQGLAGPTWEPGLASVGDPISRESPEPCARHPIPKGVPPENGIRLIAPSILWLAFDADPDPTVPGTLRLPPILHDGVAFDVPPIAFEPGARSYSYVNAP